CGNHAFLVLSFVLAVPAPTAIYPLSLHDALPISCRARWTGGCRGPLDRCPAYPAVAATTRLERTSPASSPRLRMHGQASSSRSLDRKSTRLNSSHVKISYAVFCLKKKTQYRYTNV